MSKYEAIARELERRGDPFIQFTFDEVNTLLEDELPASARNHREWWSNSSGNKWCADGWLAAGYVVDKNGVDMQGSIVRFRKSDAPPTSRTLTEATHDVPADHGLARLSAIGFESTGRWSVEGEGVKLELNKHADRKNVLYAFVVGDDVMYVGKTTMKLRTRMAHYKNPGDGQSTNIRCNKLIREALLTGKPVDIHALPDNGLWVYGGFHLNLAAGLEDNIVAQLRPRWNDRL